MTLGERLATQFETLIWGDNWTAVNLVTQLEDVTWQEATTQFEYLNTISGLVYHLFYYVRGQLRVFHGQELGLSDAESFLHPKIESQEDWDGLLVDCYELANQYIQILKLQPDTKFDEIFVDEKYGTYYLNVQGIIEHGYYHLGQIVYLKKLILNENAS